MVLIVGLTGGIGSGKTAAATFFAQLGVPVIDADQIAHELVNVGTHAYYTIIEHFGKEVLQNDGTLNRAHLRQVIFAHPAPKKWLEELLHPLIYQQIAQKISEVNYPYCIVVIPLLFEQHALFSKLIDNNLVIDAPLNICLERIMHRDNCDQATAQTIIQQQATSAQRQQIADFTLTNDSSLGDLNEKILALHQKLLKKLNSAC